MLFRRTIARLERRRFAARIHALILVVTMVLVGSVALPACGSQETGVRADAPQSLITEPALAGETLGYVKRYFQNIKPKCRRLYPATRQCQLPDPARYVTALCKLPTETA